LSTAAARANVPVVKPNGFRGVFRDDESARAVYAEGAGIARVIPAAVAVPVDADDVAALVRWAASSNTALIARGSGSGMAGGAVGPGDVGEASGRPVARAGVTLGVGEPFTTTITVSLYFALIVSLPVILYELYGFILPALKPSERRAATPLLTAVPFLFAAGVLFGYFVVLPAAVRFFVNFNSSEFNVLVQASTFYSFASTILLAMGVVFQVPVLILGATRLGLVTPRQLRRARRYALLACATVAAFLPGDAVTLVLETVPLYVLYEASILLASFIKPVGGVEDDPGDRPDGGGDSSGGPPSPHDPAQPPTVQQIIDHVDSRLSD